VLLGVALGDFANPARRIWRDRDALAVAGDGTWQDPTVLQPSDLNRRHRPPVAAGIPSTGGTIACHPGEVPLADVVLGRPPRTSQAEAVTRLGDGVTIYWRDGCPFCLRLRWAVRKYARRATWVDIWSDADAAAYVRTTNDGGNEVVPTVVIDGRSHTNPDPRIVKDALSNR
jgi:mycoredoxin